MSESTGGAPGSGQVQATGSSEAGQPASFVPGSEISTSGSGGRVGMFGVAGSGDTSGYGGLSRGPSVSRLPGLAQRPYGPPANPANPAGPAGSGGPGWIDVAADAVGALPEVSEPRVVLHRGEVTFHVRREELPAVMRLLRDDPRLRFELCSGVSGVHYLDQPGAELHAVYHLLSMTHNRRIRVETTAPDRDPRVPSLVGIYPTLDWHERETYDMFGLIFDGHPALTRILMPDDWPGHPQRKDYPLGGIPVEYKGATVPPPDQRRSYN